MDDLVRNWTRVENWHRQHRCAGTLLELHPPASEEAVQSLRRVIPHPLHPHLVQWLGIHAGAPLYDAPVWPGGHVPYDLETLMAGPAYMAEMLEEWEEQRDEDPEVWIQEPWADPLWLPVAGTHTGESLVVDHRPGDGFGTVIEIDYEGNEVVAARWRSLGEMIRLMADSLESGEAMPYAREYVRVPRLDEGPPRRLTWALEKSWGEGRGGGR